MTVGMWEREWVSESKGREIILITEKTEEGREASGGLGRQLHALASLWLPWRWCSRLKPRVTLGEDWLESHLMQNSATTWFSQWCTSEENLAQDGTRSFWACQNWTWSSLLKNDVCLTYEKFLPSCLQQAVVARKMHPLYPRDIPGGEPSLCTSGPTLWVYLCPRCRQGSFILSCLPNETPELLKQKDSLSSWFLPQGMHCEGAP